MIREILMGKGSTKLEIEKTDTLDEEAFSSICKALAHPVRIRIVSFLKKMNQCICGEIVETLPLAQSTVSQHLKVLKNSGLIKGEIEGRRRCNDNSDKPREQS